MSSKTVKFNKKKHKENDWMTDDLLDLINLKNRLYKEFKQTPTQHVEYNSRKTNLQTCQRIYKRNKDSVKRDYYFKLFNKYKSDIKNTWIVLSNVLNKRQNNQEDISLKINNTIIQDYQAIADNFNDYFASIAQHTVDSLNMFYGSSQKNYQDFLDETIETDFNFEETSEETVLGLLKKNFFFNTKGHDQISNQLLKCVKNEIAKPLTFIINQTLRTGCYPDKLKIASVRPFYKKGDKQGIENYRPISILPSVSKFFEKIIHSQLVNYFVQNKLLSDTQYGYRSGCSTEFASMELSDRIYNYLGNCQIPFAVFLDLSKAFDTLDHNILLHKLDHYGIRGVAKQLFESYITNRQQFVQINNIRSKVITTNIGVPQGSVLGPIIFNIYIYIYIYINDLHTCTNNFDIINYAEDTTLISTINQFDNHGTGMNDNINNELRNVHNWLLAQRTSLNVSKTRFMMFYMPQKNVPSLKLSRCNLNIEEVDHFNFLGLIIDKNMKWHTHVQKVANKIRNVNGILHKFKYVFPHRILILIYTSLIESHINYCILL